LTTAVVTPYPRWHRTIAGPGTVEPDLAGELEPLAVRLRDGRGGVRSAVDIFDESV
jgi:hypothetical protein